MALRIYDCTPSYCFWETIGPMAVWGSAGSPTVNIDIASRMPRLTSSRQLLGTRSRVPAAQAFAVFQKGIVRAEGSDVAEEEGGQLSAKLQRPPLHGRRAVTHDVLADRDRSRERNLVDIRMSDE